VRFFTGCHHPSDARHFECSFLSVNALRRRKWFRATDWILDSGAFTEITTHGRYRRGVEDYAGEIERWTTGSTGRLLAAVAQDYMCEPAALSKTGLTVWEHQEKTIERFDALRGELLRRGCPTLVMPVLQGQLPDDYVRHARMYGTRIARGDWVGVGSVCKRNGDVREVIGVLSAIRGALPGVDLHGFGLKTNAIRAPVVRVLLATADSLAWSYHARKQGRDGNDPREAMRWARGFGADRAGVIRESWRTIGVNEAEDWQTPRELFDRQFRAEDDEERTAGNLPGRDEAA
jgi:hypothetical protein